MAATSAVPPISRLQRLKDRSQMLRSIREFFFSREVTEVDTPSLSAYPPIDPHIDILSIQSNGEERFLHTSPEYAMKRLLAEGIGDIFQLGHVFRSGEAGERHNPEFTMLEWYRVGWTLEELQEEVCQVAELFLGPQGRECFAYHDLFLKYLNLDSRQISTSELQQEVRGLHIEPEGMDRDELLNTLFGLKIEPHLGKTGITIVTDYPASQAELSQVISKGEEQVARRFEVFFQGYELANGYGELRDAEEQTRRFQKRNEKRATMNKRTYPIDPRFIAALSSGIPECCGVAVGFDRLMMLRHDTSKIKHILPFAWEDA